MSKSEKMYSNNNYMLKVSYYSYRFSPHTVPGIIFKDNQDIL